MSSSTSSSSPSADAPPSSVPSSSPFRCVNFNAGPAGLPLEVMEEAAQEFLNYRNTGMSVLEMSHRSAEFESILAQAERRLRELLAIPVDYSVLWMQGGASQQFSAVPLNLLGSRSSAAYVVSGAWSQAAADEARRYTHVHVAASSAPEFTSFPSPSSYSLPADCAYLHYCHNETVHGVEAPALPVSSVPLVADCSSSFLSRPLDVSSHAVIYAGAQKNVGPAGVTIVIVRSSLLSSVSPHPLTPLTLDYRVHAAKHSLYNTPPTYAIYLTGLVLHWIQRQGGVQAMEERSLRKSALLYGALDSSGGFYHAPVRPSSRSRMNVVFRLRERGLEAQLIKEAEAKGMVGIAGHRSVGGVRVSLYTAVSEKDVRQLVDLLQDFAERN